MKKIILPIIVLILVVFSGCAKSGNTNNSTEEVETFDYSNLKEALDSKNSLKCTYEYKDSESTYGGTIYMEDNKFKTSMGIEGQKINSLFDGTTYYSWIDGQAQGSKMSTECLNEVSQEGVKTEEFDPNESFFSMEDFNSAFQVKCTKTVVDLSVPTNVQFQDMCELLKNLTNAFQNMNFDPDQQ